MRSRPTSSRRLFVLVLAAIVVVFVVGRLWIQQDRAANTTEASLIPAGPSGEPSAGD